MRHLAILLLCLPLLAHAHGDIHERIRALDARIAREPGNAELHLKRGRLYSEERHLDEARADFERALAIAPELHGARYFLARALLDAGNAREAREQARRFIAAHGPDQTGALSRGYRLLGEALQAEGEHAEAVAAYRSALAHTAEPVPAHYRDFVLACLAAGESFHGAALAVIDAGIARLGPVDTLQDVAVEAELAAGRTDAALVRLDVWIAQGRRLAFLQLRKAEVLAGAGRIAQAGHALAAARGALAETPAQRRRAQAYVRLQQDIGLLQARLAAAPGAGL